MIVKNVLLPERELSSGKNRITDADISATIYAAIQESYETGEKIIVEIDGERHECEGRRHVDLEESAIWHLGDLAIVMPWEGSTGVEPFCVYAELSYTEVALTTAATVSIYIETVSYEITDDWETIVANLGSGYAIGDYAMLDLGTIDGVECGTVRMCKVAEGEDGSTSTWLALDALKTSMNMNSTATIDGGWEASERRAWLNGAFFNGLPEVIRKAIVPTTRYSYSYNAETASYENDVPTTDRIWVPSVTEICTGNSKYKQENLGTYYEAIDTHISDRKIALGYGGSILRWWHRTVNTGTKFRGTAATGGASGSGASPTAMGGIVIGFSLGVSEEQPELSRGLLFLLYRMFSPAVFHALTGKKHWAE